MPLGFNDRAITPQMVLLVSLKIISLAVLSSKILWMLCEALDGIEDKDCFASGERDPDVCADFTIKIPLR